MFMLVEQLYVEDDRSRYRPLIHIISCTRSWCVFFYNIYEKVILLPLLKLYIYGPRWGQWGFWNGAPYYDICAYQTNTPSPFWKDHSQECWNIIEKQFQGFLLAFEVSLYLVFCYFIVTRLVWMLCYLFKRLFYSVK